MGDDFRSSARLYRRERRRRIFFVLSDGENRANRRFGFAAGALRPSPRAIDGVFRTPPNKLSSLAPCEFVRGNRAFGFVEFARRSARNLYAFRIPGGGVLSESEINSRGIDNCSRHRRFDGKIQ